MKYYKDQLFAGILITNKDKTFIIRWFIEWILSSWRNIDEESGERQTEDSHVQSLLKKQWPRDKHFHDDGNRESKWPIYKWAE